MPDPASYIAIARYASLQNRSSQESKAAGEDRRAATSQALRTLRGVSIVLVLTLHSTMPYLAFLKPPTSDFTHPPYAWLAFPLIDVQRWLGFDMFDAWLDVYLMSSMFFLSGLFTWPGLAGKGGRAYFIARIWRLGAPYVFGLLAIMPLALYPAYRVTGLEPSLSSYISAYLSLPFWPCGPMWFLWLLIVFTLGLALLYRHAPAAANALARVASGEAEAPGRYFLGLATAATLAYVPLALAFSPWDWGNRGPFSIQLSRPLLYAVFYLAGCGVGAHGLGDGLLAIDGKLARSWRLWFIAALASLAAWMGLTSLTLSYPNGAPLGLQTLSAISYAWAAASSVFFVMSAALRWGAARSRILDALADHSFGIYVVHYTPMVWLQYALLDMPAPAVVKAPLVLAGTLGSALAATMAYGRVLRGARTEIAPVTGTV